MILRMSEGTLRRAIKDGKVVAEQRRRNPDSQTDLRMVYEVWIVDPPAPATPIESEQAPAIRQEPPDALMPTLEALVATHERLFDAYREIADLRGRAAAAESDAKHASARATDLAERLKAAEAERDALRSQLAAASSRRRWWWPW